jgi:hypothetical protein
MRSLVHLGSQHASIASSASSCSFPPKLRAFFYAGLPESSSFRPSTVKTPISPRRPLASSQGSSGLKVVIIIVAQLVPVGRSASTFSVSDQFPERLGGIDYFIDASFDEQ